MGRRGDQTITRQWSARHQTDAQAQRNRILGNDAENRRVGSVVSPGGDATVTNITGTFDAGHRVRC